MSVSACNPTGASPTSEPVTEDQAASPTTGNQTTNPTTDDQSAEPVAEDGVVSHQGFVSRPDLAPPEVTMSQGQAWTAEYADADEHIFLTPKFDSDSPVSSGATILDSRGELVWMSPDDSVDYEYFDLRVQEYRGEPVLTAYKGSDDGGHGRGDIIILDDSYEEIARVTTGGSLGPGNTDFHESTITGEGTMLIAAYVPTPADLTAIGGPEDGYVQDAVVQEVDIATGDILFEWSALNHVPVSETVIQLDEDRGTQDEPFDYFHINSMTEDLDGAILISARHTHAVYRLDRSTGEVDWTLGGSASDFDLDEDAEFALQHDAQRAPDGTLTMFDNHTNSENSDESSRGLRLALDEETMTASMVTEYTPPEHRQSHTMANAQQLDNGNMLIGWGSQPYYSEYTQDGGMVYDACHGDACYGDDVDDGGASYRTYKASWEGQPETTPDVVIQEDDGERVAHVSWNGATEVAQWRLLAGEDEASATPEATVDRDSFETAVPAPADAAYIGVEALDAEGNVLGTGTSEE